jgi:hypothetical protein
VYAFGEVLDGADPLDDVQVAVAINLPPEEVPWESTPEGADCTAGHRAPLPGRGMVFGTSEVPSPDGGEGEDGVAAGVVPVGEGACRRVSGANARQRPGRLLLECLGKRQPRVHVAGSGRQ